MRRFYFPLSAVVLLAFAAGARAADAIVLNVTGDQTLAAALTAYNAANGTTYVDTDGGASLGAADIEVRGDGVLTFSTALAGWTGNLFVKEGATVHAASDDANYASVLGAGVSGTTTNGQVFVASGASLRIRTAASKNGSKLARPVHLAGVGVDGKGALQLASAGNVRAAFPRAILLDADAQLSRLNNDDTVGDMVMNNSTDLVLNGHVLTLAKAGQSSLRVYLEDVRILAPGAAGGLAVTDGCRFVMRLNKSWEGGENNAVRIDGAGGLVLQDDFPRAPWTLVYNTTQSFDPGNYQNWPNRDASGTVRCWAGPAQLQTDFRCIDNTTFLYQVGFRGKVTGPGGICVADTSSADISSADRLKWFHLVSGENDFTGGFAATNVLVRLGAPTAVPSGAAAGPMALKNCVVDFNYDVSAGDFTFPATTFEGAGVFHSMLYDDAARPHAGTFASLVKTGAGTLALKIRLDGGALDIREGCVRFADIVPDGVIFGQSEKFTCYNNPFTVTDATDIGWGTKPLKEVAPYILYTNTTTTALSIFSFPHGSYDGKGNLWGEKFYQRLSTYAGWLWNTSAETKTLKVVCTLNAYVRLTIGETLYTTAEPSRGMNPGDLVNPKGVWTVSVPPGANRFEVRVYDRYGIPGTTEKNNTTGETYYFCYGNVCTNGLANWDDVHGLVWSEDLSSVDLNDFHRFEDAHGGLKLTWGEDGKGAAATAHCLDALSGAGTLDLANNALTVRAPSASDFPCLSAKGATLDLGGKEATTHRLDGFVTVMNGVLVLDGDWTLAKAEVQDPDAVSAGIAFSGASRLVLSEADQQELSGEMPAGGYLLATGVTGCPKFSKAANAKIALFARDGHLILGRNPGTMVIVR